MKKVKYIILSILLLIILLLFLPGNAYIRKALIYRLPGIEDYQHFENRLIKAGNPQAWKISPQYNTTEIPEKYLADFEKYQTTAYLIVQDTQIILEQYWGKFGSTSLSNSFSMAKSVVGLLIGCAIDEGKIISVEEPVSKYLPLLTDFEGRILTIKDLLTMSAGIDWDEQYSSLFSLTTKAYYGNDLKDLMHTVQIIRKPGEVFYYQSGVTQLLAEILCKATGETLSEYASRKLWSPMGAEQDALWMLDHKEGVEKAYCCFNSNARDFARFGQLILNKGTWNQKPLVSENYITESITPAAYLKDTNTLKPNTQYGYHWWILQHRGYTIPYMRGILGQYVFVIPEKNRVVVRLGHKRADERNADHIPIDVFVWLDAALDMDNE